MLESALPTLELTFSDADMTVSYRWQADEKAFAMPIRVGQPGQWQLIQPTAEWQKMSTTIPKEASESTRIGTTSTW